MSTAKFDTIGQYLLKRLYQAGVKDIFGVPGDYVLGFYDLMIKSQVRHIGTTREDSAAFAADGYARCVGMGALAVTYGVGALNTVNAIAGAYAESSPVVLISGAPGVSEQKDDPLIHHRFGPFTFQREIFERISCASVVLNDPVIAFRQIDHAIEAARRFCKPVYIELPRDLVMAEGYPMPTETAEVFTSDQAALSEAIAETMALLAHAKSPMIVAGVELHRRGLQAALAEFVERTGLPVVATLTGKSVMSERHPAYLGIYEGAMSSEAVRDRVEQSDLLLMFGVTLNEIDTGIYTAKLNSHSTIRAALNEVVISAHRYPGIALEDFLDALAGSVGTFSGGSVVSSSEPSASIAFPEPDRPITTARLVERLNGALSNDMIVVCDVGDCLFAAIDLRVHEQSEFLASAFYTTMGFAVPAALGAQIARPDRRALILVGDGAFQMTGTELSTHARLGLNPIVVVFNNGGYSTERCILEGPFNDINPWRFDRLGEVFGPLAGYEAATESEFEVALLNALANHEMPSIINVHLAADDSSEAMKRLAEHLQSKIKRED
ncbi:Pyruvate decarboxylase (EC 4.1.1.1); Alpha-keto-acid decarboxylase (EC 4.1.1.-) [Methylomonas albis]|uniref:Alpha-keto acid decarboxylase family protein n=1 Tax=Methylomonas albis TaxID=1854563 RepID=A0ABR9CY08_9GAMM|nr:thiamine pyrophosphate-binding protein [Methylomonas albis]MBD9355620.1 alpha-keto acid decarboxylase family protein [Methylomonas albis]CAD6878632.1 Pyruvate decarboxylase (EC 4.1.1.1); Alpha-keto-acid decarboxylase (EC 4.1.1.-) [Methylomonas albis]